MRKRNLAYQQKQKRLLEQMGYLKSEKTMSQMRKNSYSSSEPKKYKSKWIQTVFWILIAIFTFTALFTAQR